MEVPLPNGYQFLRLGSAGATAIMPLVRRAQAEERIAFADRLTRITLSAENVRNYHACTRECAKAIIDGEFGKEVEEAFEVIADIARTIREEREGDDRRPGGRSRALPRSSTCSHSEDWGDGLAKSAAEFDRWLAAHDAEKRAEWEAEQGETEWEYGVESRFEMGGAVFDAVEWGSAEQAEAVARDRNDGEAEQDEDLRLIHRVVKRVASTPAGPWMSVEQGDGS